MPHSDLALSLTVLSAAYAPVTWGCFSRCAVVTPAPVSVVASRLMFQGCSWPF